MELAGPLGHCICMHGGIGARVSGYVPSCKSKLIAKVVLLIAKVAL